MRRIEFDKPVYSNTELTTEITTPLCSAASTELPQCTIIDGIPQAIEIFYSESDYRATGRNSNGDELYHVDFTYPADVSGSAITNGVYDA